MRGFRREYRVDIVLEVCRRPHEAVREGFMLRLVEACAKHPFSELHREEGDDRKGERIAEKGAEQRGEDVAAHDLG